MTSKLRDFLCPLASAWHEYRVCFSSSHHCHESVSFLRTVAAFWNPGFLGCVLAKQAVRPGPHTVTEWASVTLTLAVRPCSSHVTFFATSFMKLFLISSQLNGISAFPLTLIKGVLSPGISCGFVSWLPVSPQTAGSSGHTSWLFFPGPWEHLSIVPYIMGMKPTFRK